MGDAAENIGTAIHKMAEAITLLGISGEIVGEVTRARELHGKQADMAFGTGPTQTYLDNLIAAGVDSPRAFVFDNSHTADWAKDLEKVTSALGRPTWANVLGEEFFEAIAESDPSKLRAELIQVAAMAVSWISIIDEQAAARA